MHAHHRGTTSPVVPQRHGSESEPASGGDSSLDAEETDAASSIAGSVAAAPLTALSRWFTAARSGRTTAPARSKFPIASLQNMSASVRSALPERIVQLKSRPTASVSVQ